MIRVKAAFFSFTPPAPPDDDGSYLRWHLLDHQVEQYQLPGIQYALRYIADGDYLDARIAANGQLEHVGNLVNYLVGDPVQQTHDDFMALGPRLAEMGRFPETRPYLQLRMPALQHWYAAPQALISPEVVPFRPHRGVVVIVEEPVGADAASWLQWLHTEHVPGGACDARCRRSVDVRHDEHVEPASLDAGRSAVHHRDLPRRGPVDDDEAASSPGRGAMGNGSRASPLRRPPQDDDPLGRLAGQHRSPGGLTSFRPVVYIPVVETGRRRHFSCRNGAMSSPVAAHTAIRRFVPPPPPKTPKSAGTRVRLLEVAARLFIERGYAAVSMRDIASAAKLTKGAVYGHFRSKGQLFVEVIRWKIAERDHAPGFSEATADFDRGIGLMYAEDRRDIRLLEVDAAAAARHDPDVAAGLANLYGERDARIRDAMADVRDPDTAAWLVGVLSAGIGTKESTGLPLPDADRLHATLVAVLRALG